MPQYVRIALIAAFAVVFAVAQAPAGKIGPEFRVNTHTNGQQTRSQVAPLRNGGFVVVWESRDQDGHERGIFGQRFNRDGKPVGREFQVNSYTSNDQVFASVAGLRDGGFVVVWRCWNQDSTGWSIYAQRYDRRGRRVRREFRVNKYNANAQTSPSVAD